MYEELIAVALEGIFYFQGEKVGLIGRWMSVDSRAMSSLVYAERKMWRSIFSVEGDMALPEWRKRGSRWFESTIDTDDGNRAIFRACASQAWTRCGTFCCISYRSEV